MLIIWVFHRKTIKNEKIFGLLFETVMKFQIVSDLHLECMKEYNLDNLIKKKAEILILAGDIGNLHRFDQLVDFCTRVCKMFTYVIYVPGNHEYYKHKNIKAEPMRILLSRLLDLKNDLPNLYVLNKGFICIENICIVGCTLWTNTKKRLPHFVRINGMTKDIYNKLNTEELQYIYNRIMYCHHRNMKLIVITHHPPTYQVLTKNRMYDPYIALYANKLDHLLRKEYVNTWICGHNHHNFDFIHKNGTRIVSNQKGKIKDHINDYDTGKVIDI